MKAGVAAGMMVLMAVTSWAGRVVPLVNIQNGDRPNDSKALVELSEEHPGANGTSLKVTFSAEGSLGEWEPKIKNWNDAHQIILEVYNPSESAVTALLTVVPKDLKGKSRYNARSDNKLTFRPGQNKVTLSPQEMVSNSGDIFDLGQVVSWYIAGTAPADAVLFFQRIDLQIGE
jgi:hypothetical protein